MERLSTYPTVQNLGASSDFMAQLTVNTKVEIEGYWTNSAYVYALEAEIEY